MSSVPEPIRIPEKATFKASEVCDLLGIPAYVLRTWENEFSDLGLAAASGVRSYRRRDVEMAVLVRQLVFTEHLTLAGVRRRLEQEHLLASAVPDEIPVAAAPAAELRDPTRERIAHVKQELRALLQDMGQQAVNASRAAAALDSGSKRARTDRSSSGESSPSLPGLGSGAESGSDSSARASGRSSRLDPSALQFASVSARTPAVSRRRRDS